MCHVSVQSPLKSAFPTSASASGTPLPVTSGMATASATTTAVTSIPDGVPAKEALALQLDSLLASSTILRGRYRLGSSADRRVGGQGVVQFARHVHNDSMQYALKFYLDRQAFLTETALLCKPALKPILPEIDDVVDDGSVTVLNRPLPPMVVIARGESLDEWLTRGVDYASAMHIMLHLTQRVADVHKLGIAHRDLKPANVIHYPQKNIWTIIDFGAAADIGSVAPLSYTLSYAAPETITAMVQARKHVITDPAVDVWSLGVMAWELFTRTRVFQHGSKELVKATMLGGELLPWEDSHAPEFEARMRKLGFMRDGILRMLARDPKARISLAEVVRAWRTNLQHETCTGTVSSSFPPGA